MILVHAFLLMAVLTVWIPVVTYITVSAAVYSYHITKWRFNWRHILRRSDDGSR